ncbi:MAG: hypothetical protein ORN98_03230 [Alphaproteobacteria bacterium]|nr:hypothetical protein [Alphaproteobacteria bacterium]
MTPETTAANQNAVELYDQNGLPVPYDTNAEIAMNMAMDNAIAVAKQYGYDGVVSVTAIEDDIRHFQRRTVEACLELGKRLIILREMTAHGAFIARIEALGFNRFTAHKFMQATMKFAQGTNVSPATHLISHIDSQKKLFELLVLEDDEIAALNDGETVLGLKLDDIDKMSASEVRAALRQKRNEIDALTERNLKLANANNTLENKLELAKGQSEKISIDQKTMQQKTIDKAAMQRFSTYFEPVNTALNDLEAALKGIHDSDASDECVFGLSTYLEMLNTKLYHLTNKNSEWSAARTQTHNIAE